jgi:hypothetical protein
MTGTLFPTYRYGWAPVGLATRRQLTALGLTRAGTPIAAQITWRNGNRIAYLYRVSDCRARQPPTPQQAAALTRAMAARRTCTICHRDVGYCLPRRWVSCLDCQEKKETAA